MGVLVVPYSDGWPELFAAEARRLEASLAPWLVGPLEHVGSTAVRGLAAKPVLDMLAPVGDLDAARAALPVLIRLGYRLGEHRLDEALWSYREDAGTRTHQLHLTRPDSALWRERLAFRDALRSDPALRAEYAELKQELSSRTSDLGEYTAGKRDLVARVLSSRGVDLTTRPAGR